MNSTTNNLVLTWVPVTDVRGRARLEARWVQTPDTHAPHATHAHPRRLTSTHDTSATTPPASLARRGRCVSREVLGHRE